MDNYNKWLRGIGAGLLVAAVVILAVVMLSACAPSGPTEPQLNPKDLWISAHPTHSDDRGLCREFDGELCDEDPYDLDDLWELDETKKSSAKPKVKVSARPKASVKPAPAPTRRR